MSRKFIILLFTLLMLFPGCEVNTTVSVDHGIPPTFTLHGSGGIYFLRVYDMTDPKSLEGEWWHQPGIWEIEPPSNGNWISQIPQIKYGVLPVNFVQKTPKSEPPPALIEGRVYWVWTPSFGANGGGSNKFTIRDGQTVGVN